MTISPMNDELFLLGACAGAEGAIAKMQEKIAAIMQAEGLSMGEQLLMLKLLDPLLSHQLARDIRRESTENARLWMTNAA